MINPQIMKLLKITKMKNSFKIKDLRRCNSLIVQLTPLFVNVLIFSAIVNAQVGSVAGTVKSPAASILKGNLQAVNASSAGMGDKSNEIQKILQYYDKQIYFTANNGQWPEHVLYKADFPLGQALVTKQGMIVGAFDPASIATHNAQIMAEEKARQSGQPYKEPKGSIKGHGWMMNFVNSSPLMSIESKGQHPDFFNYLQGDASKNTTNVNNYQEVWYNNVYNNVDVRYYPSATGTLEYDIVCKPGFDKNNIALKFDGIDQIMVNPNGHLILKTSVGDMEFPAPVAYQRINGEQRLVHAKYVLAGNNQLKFELSSFIESEPLVIDPIALHWATWITNNSTSTNHGHCIWVDPSDGSIYIAGKIGGTGLITVNAFQNAYAGGSLDDIELGKYNAPDTIGGPGKRIWQTYLGGTGDDNPYAMEQGPDGNLYVVGYTQSSNFPLIFGSAFTGGGASIDDRGQQTDNIFIVKFNTAGTSYKSAIVGGNGNDDPYDLRITSTGDIIVCGYTTSTNLATLFPGKGASNTNNGGNDVLVFKINADLSAISWMKNYGGSGNDQANIMLANKSTGDIFIAGQTTSGNFPTTNPRQAGGLGGSQDGFIQKLNAAGTTVWSSYFKSASNKSSAILCMEFNTTMNKLYFGGITGGLNSANISASGVYQSAYGGGTNDFFAALMDTAQNFSKGTYLGGSNNEVNMMGLNVDLNNDVYIFGYSNSTNFPVTADALQSSLNTTGSGSNNDKTFSKLHSDLSTLPYSTYYGGTQDDYDPVGERGIKFANCRIYTIVTSESNDVPLTQGAITTNKISGSGVYEPGLVVWTNPPDLLGNTISGNQSICPGTTPAGLTGSLPSYSLPKINRNGTITTYPVSYGSAASYDWQSSTDSINWTDIPGGTTQNLAGSLIGPLSQKTFFRRIIGGDACVLSGVNGIVTVNVPLPTATISGTTAVCQNAASPNVTFTGANGTAPYTFTYKINGGSNQTITTVSGNSVTVSVPTGASGSFVYSLVKVQDASVGTCSQAQSGSITVTVNANPQITIDPLTLCEGTMGNICAHPSIGLAPYTYLWSNGLDTSCFTVTVSGTYSVVVTDANTCHGTASQTVNRIQPPQVLITKSGPAYFCQGDSVTLTANCILNCGSGVNYVWSPGGSTATSITVKSTGLYKVTGSTVPGCAITALAFDSVYALPNVSIVPGDTAFCQGGSVILNASGAGTYLWKNSNNSNTSTGLSINVSSGGTYTVTGTDGNGCKNSASRVVTVKSLPTVTLGSYEPVCRTAASFALTGGSPAGGTYSGTGVSGGMFNPGQVSAGTYTITYSYTNVSGNGCSNSATSSITVIDIPLTPGPISGPALGVCAGTVQTYSVASVSGATSYSWTATANISITGGNGTNSVTVSFGPNFVSGILSVKALNSLNCSSSSSGSLFISSVPGAPTAITGNASPCNRGRNLYWAKPVPGATSYVWTVPTGSVIQGSNSGDTITVIIGSGSGNITVKAKNACGTSTASASLAIHVLCRLMEDGTEVPVGNNDFNLLVYPNPAHDQLNVGFTSSNEADYSLRIFDMTGRLVMDEINKAEAGDNFVKLKLSFASGLYIVSLTEGDMSKQVRLVVQ